MTNYYEVLGVSNFAPFEDIKSAYRQLSKKWHPDLNNGSAYHTEKFKELQEAYSCLSDAQKRDAYDLRLRNHLNGYSYGHQTYDNQYRYDRYTEPPPSQPYYTNKGSSGTGLSWRVIVRIIYLLLIVVRVSTCDNQSSTPDASSFRIDPATRQLMDSFARTEQGDTLLNRATPPVPDLPALSR